MFAKRPAELSFILSVKMLRPKFRPSSRQRPSSQEAASAYASAVQMGCDTGLLVAPLANDAVCDHPTGGERVSSGRLVFRYVFRRRDRLNETADFSTLSHASADERLVLVMDLMSGQGVICSRCRGECCDQNRQRTLEHVGPPLRLATAGPAYGPDRSETGRVLVTKQRFAAGCSSITGICNPGMRYNSENARKDRVMSRERTEGACTHDRYNL